MIILYGDKRKATKYLTFLNKANHFEKNVFILDKNDIEHINNWEEILKVLDKVFICEGKKSEIQLKDELLNFNINKNKISVLIDLDNIFLAYLLFDLNIPTKNHLILSSFLTNYSDLQKVHYNFLMDKYNIENKRYDIVFNLLSEPHQSHVIDLAYQLEKHYDVLGVVPQKNNYKLNNILDFNEKENSILNLTRFQSLQNYDVIISPNATNNNHSISVSVPHHINEKPTNRLDLFKEYARCDYNLLPTKAVFNSTKDLLMEYQHLLKKDICLIPFGYPKLDKLLNDLKELKDVKKDAICYAPTIMMHDKEFVDTLSLNNGVFIIGELLKNFPKYKIIFRPHPKTIEYNAGKEYLNEILKQFSSNPNFIYDKENYHINTFSRTKLLISDFSGVSQSFAFATNNPVLSLSKDGFDKQYKKVLKAKDIRKKFGMVLNDTSQLVQKVTYILDNKKKYKSKIKKYKEKEMYNMGNTAKYLVDNFEYIKNNVKNPDWFYIKAK